MLEIIVIWLGSGLLGIALWSVLEKLNIGEAPDLLECIVGLLFGPIALLSGVINAFAFTATRLRGERVQSSPNKTEQSPLPKPSRP